MNEEKFFESLREDAQRLRYEPQDEFVWTRLAARIRERIGQPTVTELLAAWLRPIAASLAAIALATTIGLTFYDAPIENGAETIAADSVEISMAGDVYDVGE